MNYSGFLQASPKRRYVMFSLLFGLLFYLLFVIIGLFVVRQQRVAEQYNLASHVQQYIGSYLDDLLASMNSLLPLDQLPCAQATPDLQGQVFNVLIAV